MADRLRVIRRRTKRVVRAGAVALTAGLMVIPAVAQAVTVPPWVSGHQPSCSGFTVDASGTPILFKYTDAVPPVIVSATPQVFIVGNASRPVSVFRVRVTDACSGVAGAGVTIGVRTPSSTTNGIVGLSSTTSNAWDSVFSTPSTASAATPVIFTIHAIEAADRYDTFATDPFHAFQASTPASSFDSYVTTFKFSGVTTKVLRQTWLSESHSASRVRKGKTVTLSGLLRYANGTTVVGLGGQWVSLLRLTAGSKSWRVVARGRTSLSGAIALKAAQTRKSYYRLVFAGNDSNFTAPMSSGSVVVGVR